MREEIKNSLAPLDRLLGARCKTHGELNVTQVLLIAIEWMDQLQEFAVQLE